MSQGLRPTKKMAKMLYKLKKTPKGLQAQREDMPTASRKKFWSINYMSAQ